MMKYLKRNKLLAVSFLVLMTLAIFVRTYHFHDWLYFKMDQARDALLVSHSIENGPAYLPLLGPRAGATSVSHGYLRLGPIFYYFEYISGKIFNSTSPDVFAYPDLFFSILTIPLLYLFARFYFSQKNSFLITAMYAFSFIVIQYSRFSWNPNSLLFFTLLSFYGMMKFLHSEKTKKRILWAAVWALGVAVGSQLHFMGLFCLIGISLAIIAIHFKIWKMDSIKSLKSGKAWKSIAMYLATFLGVFILIYSPVIISEVMRKGENTKNFIEAFSTKPKKSDIGKKFDKSIAKQAKYYCLLTTSECYQGKVDYSSGYVFFTIVIILAGIAAAIYKIIKMKPSPDSQKKQDFLWLLLTWFGSIFVLAIPLYSSLRPRFFIFVFPVPFIFLGLIFEFFEQRFSSRARLVSIATILATVVILALNLHGVKVWFSEQAKAQNKSLTIQRTLILKNQDGVTYGQLERVASYMYEKTQPGRTLYFYVKPEHVMPLRYALREKKDPDLKFETISNTKDSNGQYFAVVPSKKTEESLKDTFKDAFEVLGSYQAGEIKVFELKFEGEKEIAEQKFNRDTGTTDRLFWKDVFGITGDQGMSNIGGAE